MKNLKTMTRGEMEIEILENDIIKDLNRAQKMSDEEMRQEIMNWLINGNEAQL